MATKDIDVSKVDLSDFAPLHRGPVCATGLAIELLEGEQLEKATEALKAPHIQHVRIAAVLSQWADIKVTESSVSRHRRHECSCQT